MRHVNIPLFIPHLGCPNMCVFCNQKIISGTENFDPGTVRRDIEKALSTVDTSSCETEIAFFGGSFTGIDRGLMISLLDLAESYVRDRGVKGIRMSTRPDYIDDGVIGILSRYTVSAVELGIQSFSDRVLKACRRGHTAEDSENAVLKLRSAGFRTVGQMMVGLPLSTLEDEVFCAEKLCSLGVSGARIYPTVVLKGTELLDMTEKGEYVPLTEEEAVERSAAVLEVFVSHGVPCIRIGLCDSENLHSGETYAAGPNHPSTGELVYGLLYRRKLEELARGMGPSDEMRVDVRTGDVSMVLGNRKSNEEYIRNTYGINRLKISERPDLERFEVVPSK